jgi:hypothetical protein
MCACGYPAVRRNRPGVGAARLSAQEHSDHRAVRPRRHSRYPWPHHGTGGKQDAARGRRELAVLRGEHGGGQRHGWSASGRPLDAGRVHAPALPYRLCRWSHPDRNARLGSGNHACPYDSRRQRSQHFGHRSEHTGELACRVCGTRAGKRGQAVDGVLRTGLIVAFVR